MNRALPLILTLDQHGVPHRWVTWQQAVWYYAKERVAWETGREAFTIWGGRSHLTGKRSFITANSIIAIRGKALAIKGFHPPRRSTTASSSTATAPSAPSAAASSRPSSSPATTSCRCRAAGATPG